MRMSSVPGFWAAGCFFWANTGDISHRCQSFRERRAALFRPLCLSWTPKSNGEEEGEPTTFVRSMGAGCRLGSAQCPVPTPRTFTVYLPRPTMHTAFQPVWLVADLMASFLEAEIS
jgi:hypothetical protein